MTTEYGIFTDEGCIEDGFYSVDNAQAAIKERYPEEECHVAEICHDHSGQEREGCEECNADEPECESQGFGTDSCTDENCPIHRSR